MVIVAAISEAPRSTSMPQVKYAGSGLRNVPVPIPPGTTGYLSAVVSLGRGQAVAVGARRPTGAQSRILVEQWNGTAWHRASVPKIGGPRSAVPDLGQWLLTGGGEVETNSDAGAGRGACCAVAGSAKGGSLL